MIIKSLKISNYRSFGEDVSIDFTDTDCSILLLGDNRDAEGLSSNGSGKTNFISAIFWCVFGIPLSLSDSADDVIREGTNQVKVEAELLDEDNLIRIARNKGRYNSLFFYINGELINKKYKTPTEVQKDINKYLGIEKSIKQVVYDFTITNFLSYDSVDMFVSKRYSGSDRFAFISRIFDLEKWIGCSEDSKKYAKSSELSLVELNMRKSILEDNIGKINIPSLETSIKIQTGNLKTLTENKIGKEKVKKEIGEKHIKGEELRNLEQEYDKISQRYQMYKEEQQGNLNSVIEEIKKIGKVEFTDSDIERMTRAEDTYSGTKEVLSELGFYLIGIEEDIKKAKDIESTKLICPSCSASLLKIKGKLEIFQQEIYEKEIQEKIEELGIMKDKEIKTQTTLNKIKKEWDTLKEKRDKDEKLFALEEKRDIFEENLQREFDSFSKNTSFMKDKIALLKKDRIFTDNLFISYDIIEDEIFKLEEAIEECSLSILDSKNKLLKREEDDKEKEKVDKKIKILTKEYDNYKYWNKGFLDIRRMIVQSVLPQLEEIANGYLREMETPFEIELDTLKELKTTKKLKEEFSITIYDRTTGTRMPFHKRSLGERKRIGLAVCFALQELKSLNNSKSLDFKFFDEFLDNMDEIGVELFVRLLGKTKGQNFVVSHNDSLKVRFENIITITKTDGVSTIS